MSTKLYADLGKTAKKLLNDDFITEKKISVKSVTDNGVTFTATSKQSPKDDSISSELSIKLRKIQGATTTIKLLTAGALATETVIDELGVKGLKATVNTTGFGTGSNATTKLEYVHEHAAVAALLDIVKRSATASLVVGHKGFSLGAEAAVVLAKGGEVSVDAYDIAAAYSDGKASEVVVAVLSKLNKIKASYHHEVTPRTALAADFVIDREASTKTLAMGSKHALDATTTLKAKIDSTGGIVFSYIQEIRPKTTFIISAAANVTQMDKGAKVGLSLALE